MKVLLFVLFPQLLLADVMLVHGNGESASYWFQGEQTLGSRLKKTSITLSVPTYLTESEQQNPYLNYHRPKFYEILRESLEKTSSEKKLTIVAHSFGVTLTLATLEYFDLWHRVQKFINVAGAVRGIPACKSVGPSGPSVLTCNSQNLFDPFSFGFYPGSAFILNQWTDAFSKNSLRFLPLKHPDVEFLTLTLEQEDKILCRLKELYPECKKASLFAPALNSKVISKKGSGLTHFNLPHSLELFP